MSCVKLDTLTEALTDAPLVKVYRVDVLPLALEHAQQNTQAGIGTILSHPVYWLRTQYVSPESLHRIAQEMLIDPILERYELSDVTEPYAPQLTPGLEAPQWLLEKQFLPGVTDNTGKTVEKNLALLFQQSVIPSIEVASGTVYWLWESSLSQEDLAEALAYQIFNPLVERLLVIPFMDTPNSMERYHFPKVSGAQLISEVAVICLDGSDQDLIQLSQQRNLALTLNEMKVIRDYFRQETTQKSRKALGLSQWPTDVELEIIAQTWSEHCKHKIFSARIEYTDTSNPDYITTETIDSLFKTYIQGSTKALMEKRPDLLSVFKDNAGVVQWDDSQAVCFKVETHNSPSALEPYGGAITGIVGVNRDILGTGLGAKPLFNTDVFCFAHPNEPYAKRPTMLPPETILQGVRKGVEDGGNKSGIPTVNGALVFDPRYRAKPLVFCGTGGLMPLHVGDRLGYEKYTKTGDLIVMAGGRVGKDGIHGATFSSEALHQDSPVSAVQIGDPITQKRMLDFALEARDLGLITGVTDNGAGGLSSSVGEMAQITGGAVLHLEQVPLKYQGLLPYEIVISESQERMTFSTDNFPTLEALALKHDVEVSVIGEFTQDGDFRIELNRQVVAALSLDFLHDGLPQMQLEAVWERPKTRPIRAEAPPNLAEIILKLLQSPNICSREALIRQYDHEVQGASVIKPLMGPDQTAPSDAAVLRPVLGKPEGLVVSNGICPQFSDWDTYHMAANAVDEAIRNAVAVGADPKTVSILDNFCWPDPLPSPRNPDAKLKLAQLVRACKALYDMALTYEAPLISGKDSMKNDFDDGEFRLSIPPTLLVSAISKIPDCEKAVSMELKEPSDQIFLVGKTHLHMGGSQYWKLTGWYSPYCPQVHPKQARQAYETLFACIQHGWIHSCHDLSEGGLAIAAAECVLGGHYGASLHLEEIISDAPELRWDEALFSESPSRLLISVRPQHVSNVRSAFNGLPLFYLGEVTEAPYLSIRYETKKMMEEVIKIPAEALRSAWRVVPAQCYQGGMAP